MTSVAFYLYIMCWKVRLVFLSKYGYYESIIELKMGCSAEVKYHGVV